MAKYPTLTEMGIQNPQEISSYRLYSRGSIDVLRIQYERKSGSLLPQTRRYNFGRSSKLVVTDSGTNTTETIYEISPFLSKALLELDDILKSRKKTKVSKEQLVNEINNLEADFNSQIVSIKKMIDQL